MAYTIKHYIEGAWTADADASMHPIYNPATGEQSGEVAFATDQDIANAVEAAQSAFHDWSTTTPLKRARVIFKFKDLLEAHSDELAELVTAEHGKTLADAKGSVARGIELTEFICGVPNMLKGSYSENVGTEVDSYTIRQPLGVCVGVTPFNFPVMVPIWMFVPAIACGNTFILKPSEKDPSAPMRMAELMQEAGLPDGVLNVVHGDKNTVDALITHEKVQAVSCIGSTPVAEHIYQTAVGKGKRAQAFGGAKNHCIVMPDADLDEAASAIAGAAFGSAGERCMAISVAVVVGDKIADALLEKLEANSKQLRISSGTEEDVDMGPLVTAEHRQRVVDYINKGVEEGATLVVDGREFRADDYPNGFFLGACIFDNVATTMRIYQEEIFGPVLCIVRVPDFASALRLVNEHPFGNGTAIFTRDGDTAHTFATQVQVGMVGINVAIPVPVAYHAFGGWKRSVFGDTSLHSEESVRFYTKSKTVTQRWPHGPLVGQFDMPHH